MKLADTNTMTVAMLLRQSGCSAAAVELAATAWYRRHHVGLKEGYVHEGTRNEASAPHLGLDDELDEVLTECTTDEELGELAAIAQRHGCECIGEVVREAIATEVALAAHASRAAAAAQRAARALTGITSANTVRHEAQPHLPPFAHELAAVLHTD